MGYEFFAVEVPKALHLGQSREAAAALSPNLFDSANKLVTQAKLLPIGKTAVIAVTIGGLVIFAAGAMARPYIENFFIDKRSKVSRIAENGEADDQGAAVELATLIEAAPSDFLREVDVALEKSATSMSSTEAQERFLAILMAAAFIAEQVRMLSSARIEEDVDVLDLKSAMEKLTTQQVTDSINRRLEASASLGDEETSAEFMRIFGGGLVVDGQYVPIRKETVKDALRLTGGEEVAPSPTHREPSPPLDEEDLH